MAPRLIEQFVPVVDVREQFETYIRAPADIVFDVAWHFELTSIPLIRATFWLRSQLLRSRPAESPDPFAKGIVALTRALGWGELGHRPGRELVMGCVTQPWRADVTFTPLAPQYFADFAEPDLVKIAWTLEAVPVGPRVTRFRHETRVLATDDNARRRFRRYWRWAGIGARLIRRLALPAIRRQAERRARRLARAGAVAALPGPWGP